MVVAAMLANVDSDDAVCTRVYAHVEAPAMGGLPARWQRVGGGAGSGRRNQRFFFSPDVGSADGETGCLRCRFHPWHNDLQTAVERRSASPKAGLCMSIEGLSW